MLPLIVGNIFQQIYSISDIIIVGRTIGVNALASVGAAAPVFMLLVMVTMGMANGFTVLTGQFYGAGDLEKMRRSVAMSMMLSIATVVFMAVSMFIVIDPLLQLMNLPDVLYEDTRSYVLIVAAGLWAMMAYNFFSAVLRALGDSKTPVEFLVLATVINVALALLFILRYGLGVPGSAYALVMAQGFSALFCAIYMWKKFPILRMRKEDWKWDKGFALRHLKIGLPMAGQFSILGIGILLIQSITNSFGPNTIAGFTAAIRVEQLALQPMISFGVAMAAFSAQNFGARKLGRIREAVKECSRLAMTFAVCAGIFVFIFSETIVGIFIDEGNPEVVRSALLYLNCSVPFYFFLSQVFIYRSAVQGMGVGMVPLASSLVELGMRIGVAKFLASDWGYRGVCYASPVAWLASSVFLFFAYRYFIRMFERIYKVS